MVYLTTDWAGFKDYSDFCKTGTYQIKEVLGGVEIRIKAGKLGYTTHFVGTVDEEGNISLTDAKEQALLKEILEFCRISDFVKVEGSTPDEQFHS